MQIGPSLQHFQQLSNASNFLYSIAYKHKNSLCLIDSLQQEAAIWNPNPIPNNNQQFFRTVMKIRVSGRSFTLKHSSFTLLANIISHHDIMMNIINSNQSVITTQTFILSRPRQPHWHLQNRFSYPTTNPRDT